MKIFKFGGASLQNYSRIQLVMDILQTTPHRPLVVVVSAMGKTTNALEKVVEYGYHQQVDLALQMLDDIVARHVEIVHEIFPDGNVHLMQQIQAQADLIRNMLTDSCTYSYDAWYDQVVSTGEILSSLIISACMQQHHVPHGWIDARTIIHTDARYREAELNWTKTRQAITEKLTPMLQQTGCVLTQGFIGRAPDGSTTTLGREGSDYTAAILGNILNAESVTIWKDVPGLQNADPKLIPNTRTIPEISYREVIEIAYYGAQVIHPRTIQPLQQKNIPLLVKCFLDKQLPGTRIHQQIPDEPLPPIIVWKKNQVWVEFTTRDFSFVTEHRISKLYDVFHQLHIKINLMQNGAISFSCCMDHQPEKLNRLIHDLQHDFDIQYREGMELLTIRHPQNGWHQDMIRDYLVWVEQRSPNTLQMVIQHASQASIPVVPVH